MFNSFKKQLQDSFEKESKSQNNLFCTNTDPDALWEAYLNSFEDKEFKQTQNCACCRSFIKRFGTVVTIKDGKIKPIWDFPIDGIYQAGVEAMNKLVLTSTITDVYFAKSKDIGTNSNREVLEDGSVIKWEHMYISLDNKFVNRNETSIESVKGRYRDNRNVFERSLKELTQEATETVLELISQNSLYKGEEFKASLEKFLEFQKIYKEVENKENYVWVHAGLIPPSVTKIRNSAIGTLLTDISENLPLDVAVAKFERMVAPTNYKRPTAVVTKAMVEEAEKKIIVMGLQESLGRVMLSMDDIEIENLLFVDRDAKAAILSDIFGLMKEEATENSKSLDKVEEISIVDFIEKVLPTAKEIELFLENSHLSNLVTLVGPENKEAQSLFKWSNPYSWSYTNALADSIKEQVKAAGGKVDGELRVSLSWYNYDDLDLHVVEPNGNRIYFSKPRSSVSCGVLDVDTNAGSGKTRCAVENIIFADKNKMLEGNYIVKVHNFAQRETKDLGFEIEIECRDIVVNIPYPSVRSNDTITVIEFNYSKAHGITFKSAVTSKPNVKEKWNLSTNKFHKVSMAMLSPNYWGENQVGNKHYMFIIDKAKSDETTRGFFNEFLKETFMEEKRVFEMLGNKLEVKKADKELSGLGFSSTQRNHVILRVTGKFKRLLKVVF